MRCRRVSACEDVRTPDGTKADGGEGTYVEGTYTWRGHMPGGGPRGEGRGKAKGPKGKHVPLAEPEGGFCVITMQFVLRLFSVRVSCSRVCRAFRG